MKLANNDLLSRSTSELFISAAADNNARRGEDLPSNGNCPCKVNEIHQSLHATETSELLDICCNVVNVVEDDTESLSVDGSENSLDLADLHRPSSRDKRQVEFSNIEIREYPICIGDNPGGFHGVPLTISWMHQDCIELSVDDYELNKPVRRATIELKIPNQLRIDMLKKSGYSRQEIQEGIRKANIERNRRRRTVETLHLQPMEESIERCKRALLNATVRRGVKKRERQLLICRQRCDGDFKKPNESVSTVDDSFSSQD